MPAKTTQIEILPAVAAADAVTIARLVDLINRVYAVAEEGLWRTATPRVSTDELAELVRTGQIAAAWRDDAVVGSRRCCEGAWRLHLDYQSESTTRERHQP